MEASIKGLELWSEEGPLNFNGSFSFFWPSSLILYVIVMKVPKYIQVCITFITSKMHVLHIKIDEIPDVNLKPYVLY